MMSIIESFSLLLRERVCFLPLGSTRESIRVKAGDILLVTQWPFLIRALCLFRNLFCFLWGPNIF